MSQRFSPETEPQSSGSFNQLIFSHCCAIFTTVFSEKKHRSCIRGFSNEQTPHDHNNALMIVRDNGYVGPRADKSPMLSV